MEADWEVEIGSDAPVIHVGWPGVVDLRASPDLVSTLPEVAKFPMLADALVRLNALSSPVTTSKCDVWNVEEFDPDELEASTREASEVIAVYIDIVAAQPALWTSPETAVAWARGICDQLHRYSMSCCRADLIVRRAIIDQEISLTLTRPDVGITAYLTSCGTTRIEALTTLVKALGCFTESVLSNSPPELSFHR